MAQVVEHLPSKVLSFKPHYCQGGEIFVEKF
jgi:hypothetical protein